MSDKQIVLAIFPDEAAADAAVESLKAWSKESAEKVDAIGVLCLDKDGKVKDQKLGKKDEANVGSGTTHRVVYSLQVFNLHNGILGTLPSTAGQYSGVADRCQFVICRKYYNW